MDLSKPLRGTIYVKFDCPKIGTKARQSSKYKDAVPIKAVTATFNFSENKKTVSRKTTVSMLFSRGITVHKAQGSTFGDRRFNYSQTKKINYAWTNLHDV